MIDQGLRRLARQRWLARSVAVLIGVALIAGVRAAWAQSTLPNWVKNLPYWQWYQIPNTALSSVAPNPPLPYGRPEYKIYAWNGATLKSQGSVYMIACAGGHGDYPGNEVDVLALNTETPQWVELEPPSPWNQMITGAQFYLDLKPSATHNYYATQFINARNRLFVMPSPGMNATYLPAAPAGWPYSGDAGYTCSFDVSSGTWDPPEYVPRYTGGGDFTAALVAKHPITEDIYYNRYGAGWWRWTQATNQWTRLNGNNNPNGNYSGAAIDFTRNRMLLVGSYGGGLPPRVFDLNGNTITVSFGGLGASSLSIAGYPAVVYDEANDRYLVIYNSGGVIKILRVHPGTWFVDEPTVTGAPPGSRINGISNSAQYVPELGGIVIANTYFGNVFFIRTSLTNPTPDTIPPSAPTALQAR